MAAHAIQYNIKVDLHEVKDLLFRESLGSKDIIPNPYFEVAVNGVTKATSKRNQISSTLLNESFNFTATLSADEFAIASVEITAYHKYIIQSGYIASYSFSLKHVYSKPQHWVYRQWIKLHNSEMPAEDLGILLVTVGVFGPGDSVAIVDESLSTVTETDAARVSAGPELKVTYYNLSVMIYKGQDIPATGGAGTASEPYVKTPLVFNDAELNEGAASYLIESQ